jgi:DNA repair exonuclease SbcCD ATPase subunit
MASTETKPANGTRSGPPGEGENPAVTAATERAGKAQASLKKIQQDYARISTMCATGKAAVDRLADLKKKVDAQHEAAKAAHEIGVTQLESIEHLRAFAEVDAKIAALELDLRKAEAEAAADGEQGRAAATAARERLDKEKEWEKYDARKKAAAQAHGSLDKIARENERRTKMAELKTTVARLAEQIKKKEQERESQDAKAKQLAGEVLALKKQLETAESERGEDGMVPSRSGAR